MIFNFVHDFGAIESTIPEKEVFAQPVTSIMVPIESVGKDCGLMRVFAIMLKNDFIDLAVTNEMLENSSASSLVLISVSWAFFPAGRRSNK